MSELFSIIPLEKLFRVPEPPMLIEGILSKAGITGITSPPGTGKTWLTLEMARAVVTGGKFLGHFQAKPGAVLFIGEDASIYDYARQMRKLLLREFEEYEAWCRQEPAAINPLKDRLKMIIQQHFRLDVADSVERLIATVQSIEHAEMSGEVWCEVDPATGDQIIHTTEDFRRGVDLIIIDTLAAVKRCDENNNTEMEIVFRNAREIAERTRAGLVLLHHNAHSTEFESERWRGASSQWGALDSWFQLTAAGDKIAVKVKKFRGIKPEPFHYDMIVDEDTATLEYLQEKASPNNPRAEVTDAVEAYMAAAHSTQLTVPLIVEALKPRFTVLSLTDKTLTEYVRRALRELKQNGKVRHLGRGQWVGFPPHDDQADPSPALSDVQP